VVSGKGSVSPATLERVRKAIEQLEFKPSHAARSLLTGTSQMIGVYIPILKGSFYTPILQLIDTELRTAGLHMVVAFGVGSGDARGQAVDGIQFLLERGCDGLIAIASHLSDRDIAALGAKQARIVLLNHRSALVPDQCFEAEHRQGGALAARTLLERGHRKIAVIAGPVTSPDNVERINGFLDELASDGIDPGKMWIAASDFSPEGGYAAAAELLRSGTKFTALFCANDEMAVGALSRLQEAGVKVPGQVSVLGYDDTPSAEFSAPRLTTVHIPWHDITQSGVNALLNRCYGGNRPVRQAFPISLTQRASLGDAPTLRRRAA
jgi:LacI family transcriptional regulator